MNLLYRITFRISVALLILFAAWGTLFYYIIIDEINDETDDSLEDYSEYIIVRALAGEKLPEEDNGTNNSYYITEVSAEYARNTPRVRYLEEEIYLQAKKETEPSRICKTIFKNREGEFFELTVMIPTIEKDDLKETILFWIIVLYIILLLAIITINSFVLRQSLRPLYVILKWLDSLSLQKEIPPLEVNPNISEFRKLSDALRRSAQRNADVYEQQSLFIGNASHELQTPIAIAQNRLEILADEPDLSESQLSQIVKTLKTLGDLSKLNKTLLLLARIENNHFPENAEIDVNRIISALSEDFTEAYGSEIIRTIREESPLKIRMNETLAAVLFSNLMKNAYIHNVSGGQMNITIKPQSLVFANTAIAGALDPEIIFRRFYQNSAKEGSVGLGLALVDSICKLYKMEISYRFENGLHFFEVKLPKQLIIES